MRENDLQASIIVRILKKSKRLLKYIAEGFIWVLISGTTCPVGVACSSGKNVFLEG